MEREQIIGLMRKEIKANITGLMLNCLIPNYYHEFESVFDIREKEDYESRPAMDYLLISEWLYERLLVIKEPVIEFHGIHIWQTIVTDCGKADEEFFIYIFSQINL